MRTVSNAALVMLMTAVVAVACSDERDVCDEAATIARECAPSFSETSTGEACGGAGEATARCIVSHRDAFCDFAQGKEMGGPNAFTACSAAIPAQNPESPDATTGAGAAAFISSMCDLYAPCCEAFGASAASSSSCRGWLGKSFAEGRDFDAARAEACLVALRAEPSILGLCSGIGVAMPAPCSGVFRAKAPGVPPTGVCRSDGDCAPDARGRTQCTNGSGSGVCIVIRDGAAGDGCGPRGTAGGVSTVCAAQAGLVCEPKSDRCVRPIEEGKSCVPGQAPCASPTVCTGGTCTAPPRAGEPCVGSVCGPGLSCCNDAATCSAFSTEARKCRSRGAVGASCVDSRECEDGNCIRAAGSKVGTCAAQGSLAGGAPCTSGLECASRACENLLQLPDEPRRCRTTSVTAPLASQLVELCGANR